MGYSSQVFRFPVFLYSVSVISCVNQIAVSDVHVLTKRTIFSEPVKDIPGPEKNYTGIRVSKNSQLIAYYHEQTLAIVEVGPNRELLNCELLEVRTKLDKTATLESLRSLIPVQIKIQFSDMNDLMQHCQMLDHPLPLEQKVFSKGIREVTTPEPRGFVSVFRGVFPGTKWCGAGDLAATYYDIGHHISLDKCCRTHDLCPVKVAALRSQYNLTNYSPYTRSHCDCDEIFHRCLKKVANNLSDILGNLYFNLARPVCVEDVLSEGSSNIIRKRFANRVIHY